ncbi:antibiotic biosynthesis monooxygenase family protein [Chryseomicrobium sp. FSL W7-1435]|uniref:antibiotic biosynthesis monooxygenase family protein n=1 Tax=Chryseomicrobium sp. FSL W7-1435 TaxID=2921704 RepID=UPI00315B111A
MYVVTSTFLVPPEKAQEVIAIYKQRSRKVDKEPGFIRFHLLQNSKKSGEITVYMEWNTRTDYLTWVRSQQFKDIHELEKQYPDQELAGIVPTIHQYEVVAT